MNNREEFAQKNIGLVHCCAKRFKNRGIEYEELYSAGCLGLVKAMNGFNESLGYKFSTYAVPVILGEIKRLFRDGGAVKVSRSVKELGMRISYIREKEQNDVTISRLAELLEVSEENIVEAINATVAPISLTQSDENSDSQIDIAIDGGQDRVTDKIALQTALNTLEEKDKLLIQLRYYKGLTQTQTAKILGLSQVQVSRKEKKLLQKMKIKMV